MEKKQIKKNLEIFFSAYQAVQVNIDLLSKVAGFNCDCDFGRALDELQVSYARLLSEAIGIDSGGWIDWYIHENKCGDEAMEAGFDGDLRPIKSVDDLIWAMTAVRPRTQDLRE